MAEPIGGFYASLSLLTDTNAFQKGTDALSGVGAALSDIVKAGDKLILAGAGIGIAMSKIVEAESRVPGMALAANMSTEEYQKWAAALGKAGISSDGLFASLQKLDDQMKGLKIGEGLDTALAKNLGLLGISFERFRTETSNARLMDVFKAAEGMPDQREAALLVGKIAGDSGEKYYRWLKLSQTTLESQLGIAGRISYMTDADYEKAMNYTASLNQLIESIKSGAGLLSTSIMDKFTPSLDKLNDWIVKNKENIVGGIKDVANAFDDLAGSVERFKGVNVGEALKGFTSALDALSFIVELANGDWSHMPATLGKIGTNVASSAGPFGSWAWFEEKLGFRVRTTKDGKLYISAPSVTPYLQQRRMGDSVELPSVNERASGAQILGTGADRNVQLRVTVVNETGGVAGARVQQQ
jgi:hypothetical protein